MKVAYLGKIQLSDVDLSYVHEVQQMADVYYFMEITPRFMRGPAFDISRVYPKSGVFKAVDAYPEFQKYARFVDVDKFYVVNTCGRLWQLKAVWTNFLLLVFLLRGRFDVIHAAWPPNLYEFWVYFMRRKMFLTVHDPFPHTGLDTFIVRLRRKFAFLLVPRLVILNKAQRSRFLDFYHLKPSRIIDSRLSCYTYLTSIEGATGCVGEGCRYVLFLGKIHPYKGLDYLFRAMELVHQECPDCQLIVAGSGKFHFDIGRYQTLDYIDIRNRFIPDSELVTLIQKSEFIVCPYTDATQSGVIMSAFAFNKPVIATNVGGLPEMVQHGKYGLIVREKDEQSLAEGIVFLWRNPEQVVHFSAQIGQNYGVGDLSWKKIAEELFVEYQKVMKN